MEKELHPGAPPRAKATQQGAFLGAKATALLGVKATALLEVKATPLPGVKATPLPGVKATIQGALPGVKAIIPGALLGDQAIGPPPGLQEQEEFRKIRVVTAPGAKYPRASNTTQLSQRPIVTCSGVSRDAQREIWRY